MKTKEPQLQAINVNSIVELTLLDPRATVVDIEKLCDIAYKNQYYAVCVNPCNVQFANGYILKNFEGAVKVVAVVGFPLGANESNIKIQEAKQVFGEGADEVDVVINIGRAKSLDYDYVKQELRIIKKIAKKRIVKAILDVCYFDENEIIKLTKLCVSAGVDYIQTSTGFGFKGVSEDIIKIILSEAKGRCGVKLAGGINTREQAIYFANLGCGRIGTGAVI